MLPSAAVAADAFASDGPTPLVQLMPSTLVAAVPEPRTVSGVPCAATISEPLDSYACCHVLPSADVRTTPCWELSLPTMSATTARRSPATPTSWTTRLEP